MTVSRRMLAFGAAAAVGVLGFWLVAFDTGTVPVPIRRESQAMGVTSPEDARPESTAATIHPHPRQPEQRPTKASPISLTGLQLTTAISADAILMAASRSSDPNDNVIALQLFIACSIADDESAEISLDSMQAIYGGDRAKLESVQQDRLKARAALRGYCRGSSVSDMSAFIKERVNLKGNLSSRVRTAPKSARAKDDYGASITTVLANPSKYSVALDHWLEWVAVKQIREMQELDVAQKRLARDELYYRLTGFQRDPNSIRELLNCLTYLTCPLEPISESDRLQAMRAVEIIEALIKQQRWQELFDKWD